LSAFAFICYDLRKAGSYAVAFAESYQPMFAVAEGKTAGKTKTPKKAAWRA
jgi:hypothetical protein